MKSSISIGIHRAITEYISTSASGATLAQSHFYLSFCIQVCPFFHSRTSHYSNLDFLIYCFSSLVHLCWLCYVFFSFFFSFRVSKTSHDSPAAPTVSMVDFFDRHSYFTLVILTDQHLRRSRSKELRGFPLEHQPFEIHSRLPVDDFMNHSLLSLSTQTLVDCLSYKNSIIVYYFVESFFITNKIFIGHVFPHLSFTVTGKLKRIKYSSTTI